MATPPRPKQPGYPSEKAVGAISSRSQVQIRRMLLEGNPVIVAMRPHERPSRWRMFCISSARFRLTPLRRPRCLPVALTRSSPASVRSRARSRSISAKTMARVQHRPPHGAVLVNGLPEADDFDALLAQPAQQLQHLGQRPAQAVQRRHLHAVARLEGGLQAIQPRPVPRGPAPHVLEDLLAVGQHPALVLQVVGVGVAGHRHAGVSEQFSAHLSLAPGSGMAA